jgi:hypothetical protein
MRIVVAIYRLSLWLIVGSLLIVPTVFVLHFAGLLPAIPLWLVMAGFVVWVVSNHLRAGKGALWEALSAPCDRVDGPFWLLPFGLVFAGAGIFIWMSDLQHPTKGEPPSPAEQFIFGMVFFGAGSGAFGIGAASVAMRMNLSRKRAEIERHIAMRPDSAEAQLEMATLLMDQRKWHDAFGPLDQAVRLAPQSAEARLARGRACYYADRLDQAIADLTRAIELAPGNREAYLLRSLAYEDSDQPDLAAADDAKADELEARPGDAADQ